MLVPLYGQLPFCLFVCLFIVLPIRLLLCAVIINPCPYDKHLLPFSIFAISWRLNYIRLYFDVSFYSFFSFFFLFFFWVLFGIACWWCRLFFNSFILSLYPWMAKSKHSVSISIYHLSFSCFCPANPHSLFITLRFG